MQCQAGAGVPGGEGEEVPDSAGGEVQHSAGQAVQHCQGETVSDRSVQEVLIKYLSSFCYFFQFLIIFDMLQ